MHYRSSLAYLSSLELFGIKLGLASIRRLLELSGHPERGLVFYHVAGTNGKGSTAAFLQALLMTDHRRVGLYTSPHLIDFRERIRINRTPITRREVAEGIGRLRPLIRLTANTPGCSHPTYFEAVTALACRYFHDRGADAVVWETGLGGRLDATNAVVPAVSVITDIAREHTRYLGTTLARIAREKAGIVKPSVPLVSSVRSRCARRVIRKICRSRRAPLIEVPSRYAVSRREAKGAGALLDISSPRRRYSGLPLVLFGAHQEDNLRTALAAWETGDPSAARVPLGRIRRALRGVSWPGRFEVIPSRRLILDGAHNPSAARALSRALADFLGPSPLLLILGVLSDKDAPGIARFLIPLAREVVVVPPPTPRALSPDLLAVVCRRAGVDRPLPVRTAKDLEEALRCCYHALSRHPESWICVTGSLYLVGEAKRILRRRR
jgi:dihydrofolate synthase/folylpolyglutamate synthase